MNLQKVIPTLVATLICWLSAGLALAVTPSGASVREVVIGFAFLATAMLWVRWAYARDGRGDTAVVSEKAKRHAGNDPTAALLLELLSEDERREVKERLLDRLQTDGETSPLADLLDDQEPKARRDVG
jgi:hypothetical protein